jgi:hypothetical protein
MSDQRARVLRWWPFLLPPLYLGLIFYLQPIDHLGDPETSVRLGRLVYDDYDMTAFAQRGLNAVAGRTPGGKPPAWITNEEFRDALSRPFPLQEQYFLEYPPAALPLFALGWWLQPGEIPVPAAVLDSVQNRIVEHWPSNDDELGLWRSFRQAIHIYVLVMTLCLLGTMAVLHVGYEPDGGLAGPVFLFVLPAALYFSLNRFDIVPALLVALSLACLGRRYVVASAVLLGLATMVKVYPLLLAPFLFRYLSDDRRRCLTWAGVYGATMAMCFLPPILAWGSEATWAPYHFQLSREFEPGWTLYGIVLPSNGAENTFAGRSFRLGSVALVSLAMIVRRPENLASVLRRGLVVLIVFVALQVFYSPQWIVWFLPLLVPLARLHTAVLWSAIALDLITYLSFPVTFDMQSDDPLTKDSLRAFLIVARAAVLALMAGLLLDAERRSATGATPKPSAAPVY